MKNRIFLMLLAGLFLATTSVSAQVDSAAMAKRQKEIERSEKDIKSAQAKVDKKEKKMARAQRRADRKARKAEKKLNKLRKAERKHDKLVRDTSTSFLQIPSENAVVTAKSSRQDRISFVAYIPDPADRLYHTVRG